VDDASGLARLIELFATIPVDLPQPRRIRKTIKRSFPRLYWTTKATINIVNTYGILSQSTLYSDPPYERTHHSTPPVNMKFSVALMLAFAALVVAAPPGERPCKPRERVMCCNTKTCAESREFHFPMVYEYRSSLTKAHTACEESNLEDGQNVCCNHGIPGFLDCLQRS